MAPAQPADLCDRCLGRRLIGAVGAQAQMEAGAAHRSTHEWPAAPAAPADCPVCEDAWDVEEWLQTALAAVEPYGFSTFQVGTRFPAACEEAEREAASRLDTGIGDTVRTEANRLLAPGIAAATGAEVAAEGRPDVVVHVDTRFWTAEARANSVFVRGRYTKHSREIPQTHWPCKTCQGRGCHVCDDKGAVYPTSVEDELAAVLVPAFGAAGQSFHGAGREDIDALMLGTGRPFVMELHDPKRRSADLSAVEAHVAARWEDAHVGATGLGLCGKEPVAALKAAEYDKEYLAHCETDEEVPRSRLEDAAATLSGASLEQRTPQRVSHRRADLVRRRRLREVQVDRVEGASFTLRVRAESGTYIKEFVSGDEGRTEPSLAATLGVACRVATLDVIGILDGSDADLRKAAA